jgi:hypothetical protein
MQYLPNLEIPYIFRIIFLLKMLGKLLNKTAGIEMKNLIKTNS